MKELLKKSWSYTLYEDNIGNILQVICGGVALFEVTIRLNTKEEELYASKGEVFIDDLAKDIQNYPTKYTDRNIDLTK